MGRAMATIVQTAHVAAPQRPRVYVRPTLIKGPVLAKIAANKISGVQDQECWVARAAFGEADFRWMIFRAWLTEDAPNWFRWAYRRYGLRIGAWLSAHDRARAWVRAAMMVVVRRKVACAD
jgi:hypothetical protein